MNQTDKQQRPTFILCDTDLTRHTAGGANAYLQYVRHVTNTASPSPNTPATPGFNPPSYMGKVPDAAVEFTQGYADFLQAPLQPLMDDLGSMTYEVFERDPVKYNQYEEVGSLAVNVRNADDRRSRLRYKIYRREKLSECS
jgi:protein arginine N-methyltransferase 5